MTIVAETCLSQKLVLTFSHGQAQITGHEPKSEPRKTAQIHRRKEGARPQAAGPLGATAKQPHALAQQRAKVEAEIERQMWDGVSATLMRRTEHAHAGPKAGTSPKAGGIIALGPGGTGKTHIALGLGLAACQKGRKVRFTTAAALVHELIGAVDERRLQRLQKQLVSQDLLIIDVLGFVPLSKTGAELLFEIISQRYERGSIIITSNLPFDQTVLLWLRQGEGDEYRAVAPHKAENKCPSSVVGHVASVRTRLHACAGRLQFAVAILLAKSIRSLKSSLASAQTARAWSKSTSCCWLSLMVIKPAISDGVNEKRGSISSRSSRFTRPSARLQSTQISTRSNRSTRGLSAPSARLT